MFQYLSGNAVREIVPDMFSTYMGTRLIANLRDTKGIILSVMPPYMHWIKHRRSKAFSGCKARRCLKKVSLQMGRGMAL